MNDINTFFGTAGLTADPEFNHTKNGTAVCNLSLACNREFNGNQDTTYLKGVLWKVPAEISADILRKGDRIAFSGRLDVEVWEGSDGHVRKTPKVVIFQFRKLEKAAARSERASTRVAPDSGSPDPALPPPFPQNARTPFDEQPSAPAPPSSPPLPPPSPFKEDVDPELNDNIPF